MPVREREREGGRGRESEVKESVRGVGEWEESVRSGRVRRE